MRERGGMIAQPGVDAAHGIPSERIRRRQCLRSEERSGGIRVATNKCVKTCELRLVFATPVAPHRRFDQLDAVLYPSEHGCADSGQEVSLGRVRRLGQPPRRGLVCRIGIATPKRRANGRGVGGTHALPTGLQRTWQGLRISIRT